MADEEDKGGRHLADALFIIIALVVLATVWFASGGPGRASFKGIFLAPPPPLGTGESYGPKLGTTTPVKN